MFYRPEDGHGLPHNPFGAIVNPRPIAWVGTRGTSGDNLAPYSFFNALAYTPPQVMFASNATKDSLRNILETGVFSISMVEYAQRAKMNLTSGVYPPGVDEFAVAGVTKAECLTVRCPRVADAPACLECELVEVVRLRGPDNCLAIGEVKGVHLRDDCLVDGRFDVTRFGALARGGYRDYSVVTAVFEMIRPDET
ncbi:MAG: flavin reductase family protein [Albidovulum sp.]